MVMFSSIAGTGNLNHMTGITKSSRLLQRTILTFVLKTGGDNVFSIKEMISSTLLSQSMVK